MEGLFVQLFADSKTGKSHRQDSRSSSLVKMLPILLLLGVGVVSVHGHGGVVWPPIWQDGVGLGLDEVYSNRIQNVPEPDYDWSSGKHIVSTKAWLTDQAYTGGHGEEYQGNGTHTNMDHCNKNMPSEKIVSDAAWKCADKKHPWAAPGVALSIGGGCGVHGGNPLGCPAYRDPRDPGSVCLSEQEDRGTWSKGIRATNSDLVLPSMVTKWARGSIEPVGFVAIYHGGGYTYRLCKMPLDGKEGLTEECFIKNILKFAENKTYWRNAWKVNLGEEWKEEPKTDLTVGTYPEGSAWRYQGPIDYENFTERFYKDLVVVPEDLELGEYVLSWRWDAATAPQVWVSCSSIEIVDAI